MMLEWYTITFNTHKYCIKYSSKWFYKWSYKSDANFYSKKNIIEYDTPILTISTLMFLPKSKPSAIPNTLLNVVSLIVDDC